MSELNAEKIATVPKPKLEDNIIVWDTDKGEVKLSVALVRMYFCPEASTVEAMTFLSICKYQKLNPWLREAYLIKFGNSPASIVVGKDTFSKRAVRNPKYQGFNAGIVVQKGDAVERREGSLLLKDEPLVGGWCKVLMKDREAIYAEVSLSEYEGRTKEGDLNRTWRGKSATMIRKVAYVQAHREAMPEEFEGLYDESEIRPDEKKPESFGMPLSVDEAAAKEQAGNDKESPAGPAETATPSPSVASEAPAGDIPPEVDQQGLEAEARAREQAEAAAEQTQTHPTGRVDRQAVWEALLQKAKEMKVSSPTGLLKSLTGGKTSLASMNDAEIVALAKKLEA